MNLPSDSLQSVASFLITNGLLGMLITMPPTLLLTLGLKIHNRWTCLLGGGLMLSLACSISGIAIEGLVTGEGLALSKSTLMVQKAERPVFFWISTAAFLMGAAFIAICGVFVIWRGFKPVSRANGATEPG